MKKNKVNIGIIVQARTGSSRLPGKVLMNVNGTTLLEFIYSRIKPLKQKYKIIIATTTNEKDNDIEYLCNSHNIICFRGNENDVLDRFYQASIINKLDIIVRINADSPFLDAEFIEDKIKKFIGLENNYDYGSTILDSTYPIGMHVEIMTFKALSHAHQNCTDPFLREHVTPFIYKNPQIFVLKSFKNNKNLSHLRLTVDYQQDLVFINHVVKILERQNKKLNLQNIVNLVSKSTELKNLNQHIKKVQKIN